MKHDESLRDAAVLVPVYRRGDDDLHLIVIRRTEGGVHGGQLAFPGGRRDPQDRSLLDVALREAHEEIGLDPDTIDVLTPLPVVETISTGYRIFPFLGRIVPPKNWRWQEAEVAEVLDVRVADLVRPEAHQEEWMILSGWSEPRLISYYRVGPHRLWGASYRILHPLVPRLANGEFGL